MARDGDRDADGGCGKLQRGHERPPKDSEQRIVSSEWGKSKGRL
jgi:hypothetical protein